MLDRTAKFLSVTSLTFSLLFLWCLPATASLEPAGHVILTNGPFIAIQTNASARSLSRGSEFYQGDRLWTGPRTQAQIRFSDGAIMTLRPDTEFSVDEYQFDENNADNNTSLFTLIKGGFRTLTGLISKLRPDGYRVKTAYAIVGVRGTTYEVVDQSALYVAAWEGTISVTNNKSEMLLGFGQDFNYATITSINSAPKGTVEVPPPLQQAPDPGLQQAMVDPTETRLVTSLANDGIDPRLTPAEWQSLTQFGMATVPASRSSLSGPASDGSLGSPIIFSTTADTVLREGGTGTFLPTNTSTPTVAWGAWNGGLLQPNSQDANDTIAITSPVFWATMQPATSLPTGVINYGLSAGFSGAGVNSAGLSATVTAVSATVNFGTADVSGFMQVQAPSQVWDANFSGKLAGTNFALPATGSLNGVANTLEGNVTGALSGTGAQGMGGVFDFQEVVSGSPTGVSVNGVFAATKN